MLSGSPHQAMRYLLHVNFLFHVIAQRALPLDMLLSLTFMYSSLVVGFPPVLKVFSCL